MNRAKLADFGYISLTPDIPSVRAEEPLVPLSQPATKAMVCDSVPHVRLQLEPVMTFEEIGRELGISTQAAQWHYHRGITKLRRRPHTMSLLRGILSSLRNLRDRREVLSAE